MGPPDSSFAPYLGYPTMMHHGNYELMAQQMRSSVAAGMSLGASVSPHTSGVAATNVPQTAAPGLELLSSLISEKSDLQEMSSDEGSDYKVSTAVTDSKREAKSPGRNSQTGKVKKDRVYIDDDIQADDILCGRGGRSNNHIGNKRYRQVVNDFRIMYQRTETKTVKTDLSRAIVEHCCAYGARFLKSESATGRYFVLTKAEARKKTSQALRETKDLKWTAPGEDKPH